MLSQARIGDAVAAVARCWIEHADELTRLDQAIGDGDHGANMRRGAQALLAEREAIAAQPLPDALSLIGQVILGSVGGASGPLYGSFFLSLGRSVAGAPDRAAWSQALGRAVDAVARRGRSGVGEKTMLDALAPAEAAFAGCRDAEAIEAAARAGAAATVPMRARCGRAAYFAERSVGHMDPGAWSSALAVAALCALWSGRP